MASILLLFFIVIGISFICSLLEAVLLSCNSAYIGVLIKEGKKSGQLLEHHKENLDKPLAAILTLNTLSHTLGSAAVAASIQKTYGDEVVTIASFILTFFILVFSEILPKSIGASHWKALAPLSAYIIQAMVILLYPFVILSMKLGKLVANNSDNPEVTREEVLMTAELGVEEGTIKNKESNIIRNLLTLDKLFVSDIMTPRSVFFALESDETVQEVFSKYKPIRFSRIPVYHDNIDHIVGMTFRYKIHEAVSHDEDNKKIGELATPITSIPENTTVSQVLDYFIKEKEHIALAIDEYGVTTGLVSLEDAVETLLGVEIVDELDTVADMRQYALEQWKVRKQKIRKN
ncbi:MAG: CNNM domain-containing protein [Pseudobdellovibrionaceae bacterium]